MEVLAERLVQSAQQLLQSTADMKCRAFLAHAVAQPGTQQRVAEGTGTGVQQQLGVIKSVAEHTLEVSAGLNHAQ